MFWVALATAIMLLSGDGDDTRAIRDLLAALRQQIPIEIQEPERARAALHGIDLLEETFRTHRARLHDYTECVQKADQLYAATEDDYLACEAGLNEEAIRLAESFTKASKVFETAVTRDESKAITDAIGGGPQGEQMRTSMAELKAAAALPAASSQRPASRSRGLEGEETTRHLTLPRNVVGVLYGPLQPQLFGQRYDGKTVEAGTTYQRLNPLSTNADGSPQWWTRLGVAFGLFDDFEAGAVFVPVQLSPKVRWDQILVFLTQQFRQKNYDLGLRFSFQTPGSSGWSINPGGLFRWPKGPTRLDVGLNVPMELGSLKAPEVFLIGVNLPVRETLQLTPNWYMTLESGFVRTSFQTNANSSIPLGIGSGYTILAGKKLIDITALFQWDDLLMPHRPEGTDLFQPGSYRAVFGLSTHGQAL